MQSKDILAPGLGLESPWELVDQELNTVSDQFYPSVPDPT